MESNENTPTCKLTISKRDEYCCVPLCNGNARIHHDLSFHHIPKKLEMRKKWLVAIRRDEGPQFKIGNNTVVCSRHFNESNFRSTLVRKCLKADAVPSVFPWTQNAPPRKPPRERHHLPQSRKILRELPSNLVDQLERTEPGNHEIDSTDTHSQHCDGVSDNDGNVMDNHAGCKLKVEELQEIIQKKNDEIHKLNEMLLMEKFGVNRFSYDDDMIEFYTGFPTYSVYIAFYNAIKPTAQKMKTVYYNTSDDLSLRGRPKSMILVDELFMFLCRLRCGYLTEDLSVRFNIHKSTVSRKILTWTNYLYFILGSINIWPTREQIVQNMPQDFQVLYPRTRIIIDCTEIFTEKPSSLALASKTFSSYKSHNTWKGLVGIAPHGAVTFISSLYTGCV